MNARRVGQLVQIAALVLVGAGCPGPAPAGKRASAQLDSRSGSNVKGTATFIQSGDKVELTLNVSGASPGQHAVHLHAVGDCSAGDATSAMGHWNPDMMNHGLPSATPHHLGDCGNLTVAADGTGTLTISNDWSIGTGDPDDIIDKAIIVHALVDDGVTQNPPGAAGARQACGVIAK
jgi:Cu-Zn family superoxide dismutase